MHINFYAKFFKLFLFVSAISTYKVHAMQQTLSLREHIREAQIHGYTLQQQYSKSLKVTFIQQDNEIICHIEGRTSYNVPDTITLSKLKDFDELESYAGTIVRNAGDILEQEIEIIDPQTASQYYQESQQIIAKQQK